MTPIAIGLMPVFLIVQENHGLITKYTHKMPLDICPYEFLNQLKKNNVKSILLYDGDFVCLACWPSNLLESVQQNFRPGDQFQLPLA